MKEVPFLLEAVAQTFQEAREYARLSQSELAERAECARSFISFIETRNHLPGLPSFVVLAEKLDVAPSELMRRIERKMEMMRGREKRIEPCRRGKK